MYEYLFSQAGLTYLAVQRYRSGAAEAFTSQYEGEPGAQPGAPSPYSTYAGGETGDPYQQPPFSGGGTGGMQQGMQGGMGGGMQGAGGMGGGTNTTKTTNNRVQWKRGLGCFSPNVVMIDLLFNMMLAKIQKLNMPSSWHKETISRPIFPFLKQKHGQFIIQMFKKALNIQDPFSITTCLSL